MTDRSVEHRVEILRTLIRYFQEQVEAQLAELRTILSDVKQAGESSEQEILESSGRAIAEDLRELLAGGEDTQRLCDRAAEGLHALRADARRTAVEAIITALEPDQLR